MAVRLFDEILIIDVAWQADLQVPRLLEAHAFLGATAQGNEPNDCIDWQMSALRERGVLEMIAFGRYGIQEDPMCLDPRTNGDAERTHWEISGEPTKAKGMTLNKHNEQL